MPNRRRGNFKVDKMKYLGWFNCDVTSAVACKLAIDKYGDINIETYTDYEYNTLVGIK